MRFTCGEGHISLSDRRTPAQRDWPQPAQTLVRRRLRFGDLRSLVDGISAKVLTETLRGLERDGLVARHAYAEIPPWVEYELTALGRTLHAPLQALGRWAEEHIEAVLAARQTYDARS